MSQRSALRGAVLSAAIWMLVTASAFTAPPPDSPVSTSPRDHFALILMANQDIEQASMARDYVQRLGGRIAVLVSPHAMVGWIAPELALRLEGAYGIERISYAPVESAEIPYEDTATRQAASFFNAFLSGEGMEERAKAASSDSPLPLVNDARIQPDVDWGSYIDNLPPGTAPALGNSDRMIGTVAVALFFVESNGALDTNKYTWSTTDQNDTLTRALSGLTWWANKAALEGRSLSFTTYPYLAANSACQQGYEPTSHPSSDDDLWINAIMSNLGYNSGGATTRVLAFNTWLRGNAGTNWSFSVFIGYNPSGAPTTFTDGYFAYAYVGGPYVQTLFNNDGWGASRFGYVLSHETGHIFWACDEYYQAGYGGCTSCGSCYGSYVPNYNCEYCNSSSVSCIMRDGQPPGLCEYTKYQIGWLPLPAESSSVGSFSIAQGGTYAVTFDASNGGSFTEAGHVHISVSSGLEIIEADGLTIAPGSSSSQAAGGVTYVNYPVGSTISTCSSGTMTAAYQLLDIYAAYAAAQDRSFSVKFRAKTGAASSQWVDHRAAFYVPNNFYVRDPLSGATDQQGCYARVISVTVGGVSETVSVPTIPDGAASGSASISYEYATGGSTSSLGHSVQYYFDWGDSSNSGWLSAGTLTAAKAWPTPGTYSVKAKARCATDTAVESGWSDALSVTISALSGDRQILPEVIWASASGGGDWVTEVQVTDVTGGSAVSVVFDYGAGNRRGPFTLWTGSGAFSSAKFSNLLQSIDSLDAESFTYYGRVGAAEFLTQDASHKIRVAARTFNGNYSKTFPGLSDTEANSASTSREMLIQNLSSNAGYRSTVGCFNPAGSPVVVEFRLADGSGSQVGPLMTRTFAGFDFQAFDPFAEAGLSYPGYSYDNMCLYVRPTSGAGRVICFGATADNSSNDPASHVAVQNTAGFDNSPGNYKVLPEAIWAKAKGAGTWTTGVQITDTTGGSVVSVYFNSGGGNRRGPFTLSSGTALAGSVKIENLLETLDGLDAEAFDYYGSVGAVEFVTQDSSHKIQITARTLNGANSKTFPGLSGADSNTAATGRPLMVQNFTNNATYRSTVGCFNPSGSAVTVEFRLIDSAGSLLGAVVTKAFASYDFQAFDPFAEAGVSSSADNVLLEVRPVSGSGQVMSFGATANNASNDPASHIAVRPE